MQTFLSEETFAKSLRILDNKRLNKQLLESLQILKVLTDPTSKAWRNHPAVLQWKGFEKALLHYAILAEDVCYDRGIKTTKNKEKIDEFVDQLEFDSNGVQMPDWWLSTILSSRVIFTHRARLFEKDPNFYSMYEDFAEDYKQLVCCPNCNYFWPSHFAKNKEKH